MIWRSLIFFSLSAAAQGAIVSGHVVLRDSRVTAVKRHMDYEGVVISLVRLDSPPDLPAKRRARMLQKDKTFTPHVLPVAVGTTVDFPNADPIFHNAFSSYDGQIFDVGLYPPGTNRSVHFMRPGVVRVFCNIHPAMSAIILVLATPYFVQTGRDGAFELNAPAGEYQLDVFHERATEETLQELTRKIRVANDPVKLASIAISESGYLALPHKNKYGHDYAPDSGDDILYPGARK